MALNISDEQLVEGFDLPAVKREMTLENMRIYEGWPAVKNLHSDDDEARKLGLPKALARAHHYLAYATEVLCNVFGEHWLKTGKLSANMMVPVFPGDIMTASGKIVQKVTEKDETTYTVEILIANQKNEKAAAGTATVTVTK
jgi:acyl dehydratase